MDWDFAIERHRVPLLGCVMGLLAEIGLLDGDMVERVSKPLYRQVLRILLTAESAVRRIIIVAARDIVIEPRQEGRARRRAKSAATAPDTGKGEAKAGRKRRPLFNLFDPPKRLKNLFRRLAKRPTEPRIQVVDVGSDPRFPLFVVFAQQEPPSAPPAPAAETVDDGTVNAGPLIRRLLAIKDALDDIPRQAHRYARWRDTLIEDRHPQRESALRAGRPPGFRKRPLHPVDAILKECHWLARNVQPQFDSS